MTDRAVAWAVVGIKSQRILRDMRGHYAIYTHRQDAVNDMPRYGEIRRITMRLQPRQRKNARTA